MEGYTYNDVEMLIMNNLWSDVLIGHDILKSHSSVEIAFHGDKPPFKICSLAIAKVPAVSLLSNLISDFSPMVTKSRHHSAEDYQFIASEVERLLDEGIMEPNNSPWRAQAFVVKGDNHKTRMVIDYSQTINRFTMLDAYSLPRIEVVLAHVSKYNIFSTITYSRLRKALYSF
jgi:hypothetical protein